MGIFLFSLIMGLFNIGWVRVIYDPFTILQGFHIARKLAPNILLAITKKTKKELVNTRLDKSRLKL